MKKPLIRREHYNKKTDKIEIRFYNGRKRATDKERKDELKNPSKPLNREYLSKADNAYIGRVIGGRNRAKQAVRIDGKYVSESFFNNPNSPIQWNDIATAKGYKNKKELFDNDEPLYEMARNYYYSKDGLPFKYSSDTILDYVDTFGGKIFINGSEISKLDALIEIDDCDKRIKRKYGSFFNEYHIQYKAGFTELHIHLPSKEKIKESDSPEDLEEDGVEVGYEQTDEDILERQVKKWEAKENPPNPDRFNYEVRKKVKGKGGKYTSRTEVITGRSFAEAKVKAKRGSKKDIIIHVERTFKNPGKKKK